MRDLNSVSRVSVYIDGADEATRNLHLVKGGGGALTREKILAAVAERFVCIVDDTKLVDVLGAYPLPVEVIPMARGYVARELAAHGGRPTWREGAITDNGNEILDVHDLCIRNPGRPRIRDQSNHRRRARTGSLLSGRPICCWLQATTASSSLASPQIAPRRTSAIA